MPYPFNPYRFDDEEDDFYSVDYEDEKKKSTHYDPLSYYGSEILGKTKKLDSAGFGQFVSESNDMWSGFNPPRSSTESLPKTEATMAPIVEQSKYKKDYDWWRDEKDYTKWLSDQGFDPERMDDLLGNKMFQKYIEYKAENPTGFGKLSADAAKALGKVVRVVGDVVNDVPVIGKVAKPMGSFLQFVGNLLDAPRNIIAGVAAAVFSDHPEEIGQNIWDALQYAVSAKDKSGREEGEYFSFMDAQLRNLVDKAKAGMSEEEYKNYIDSDSFRQSKRMFQLGGMALDMVLDPAWLLGAGEVKAYKLAKQLGRERKFLDVLATGMKAKGKIPGKIAFGRVADTIEDIGGLEQYANRFRQFNDKVHKTLDFIYKDKSFMKSLGLTEDSWIFRRTPNTGKGKFAVSTTDASKFLLDKFDAFAKGKEVSKFSYAMRFKVPFVNRQFGGFKISPSLQPVVDTFHQIFGGYDRGELSRIGRLGEKAAYEVNIKSDLKSMLHNESIILKDALDRVAKNANPQELKFLEELKTDPSRFENLVADIFERNPNNRLAQTIKVAQRNGDDLEMAMFETNKPILDKLFEDKSIIAAREEWKKFADGYRFNSAKEMAKEFQIYKYMKGTESFNKDLKKIGINQRFIDEFTKFELDLKNGVLMETPENLKKLEDMRDKFDSIFATDYYMHILTPEAKKLLRPPMRSQDDVMIYDRLVKDYSRHIYIPTDYTNDILIRNVFGKQGIADEINDASIAKFKNLIKENPHEAFLTMQEELRRLYYDNNSKFSEIIHYSNKMDGDKVLKYNDPTLLGRYYSEDIKPLLIQGNVSLLNDLSSRGLLIRNFNGQLFEGGIMPLYQKIMSDAKSVERLRSVNDVMRHGMAGGWMKHVGDGTKAAATAEPGWLYQSQGIFKGYAIRDYLDKPMKNAVKGIMDISETLTNESIISKVGELAKAKANKISQILLGRDIINPAASTNPLDLLEHFNRWWKVNIYLKNPAAHQRNFLSNRLMMMGDGIHPFAWLYSKEGKDSKLIFDYNSARTQYVNNIGGNDKLVAKLKTQADELGNKVIDFDGKSWKVSELAEEMMRLNISSTGITYMMLEKTWEMASKDAESGIKDMINMVKSKHKKSFWKDMNIFGTDDYIARKATHYSSLIENRLGRNEYFFHLVNRKGYTMEQAASRVNEILIDYNRVSNMENSFRKYLYPFYCVPNNTEILTENGWKFYNEIKIGDNVLTYNLGMDQSEWEPIKDIAIFDYDGDLLEIGNSYHRFMFTNDHRVPIVKDRSWFRRIVRAYELKDGDRIPLAAEVNIPNSSILTVKDAILLAWIVTDGYFRWRGNSFESVIYQSPGKYASKIRNMFKDYISSESIHPDTGVICFRLKIDPMKNILKYFKSKNDLPKIVTKLNREALEGMFEAMMDAEGCRNNSNSKYDRGMGDSFNQKLGSVMDAFQIICLLLGKAFQISYSSKYDRATGYVKKSRYHFYHKKHNKTVSYNGKIWCPKTGNSTWYMRQNGKVMITGNTWQSRMIPVMGIKAIEQPGYFTKITQLQANAYNALELDRTFAPAGEKSMEGIPMIALNPENVGKYVSGKPLNEIGVQYISGEGWLPQSVLNLFKVDGIKDFLRPDRVAKEMMMGAKDYLARGISPLLKTPIENQINYSFQFERPLSTYYDETIRFLGQNVSPKTANAFRSFIGQARIADDIINTWDKNAITGQPKFTVYDLMFKNLVGYRPYQRNEISEVNRALGKLKEIYQGNLSDAKRMVNNKDGQARHAKDALMAYHGIKVLSWYKQFITEVRSKEATIRGIELNLEKVRESLSNQNIKGKKRMEYMLRENDLVNQLLAIDEESKEF